MDPGFAVDEWRELKALSEDLRDLSEQLDGLRRGMRPGLRSGPIERYARTLRRMSKRWDERAEIAKEDAIRDHKGDYDWQEAKETVIDEDIAVSYLSGAVAELRSAERRLWRDEQTKDRLQQLRQDITDLTMKVNNRDLTRRLSAESDY